MTDLVFIDMGDLGKVRTLEYTQARVNERYDQIYHQHSNGERLPYVCTFCDEFIMNQQDLRWLTVDKLRQRCSVIEWSKVLKDNERIPALEEAFRFNDNDEKITNSGFLSTLAMSPRGTLEKKSSHHRSKLAFSSCSSCKSAIEGKYTPFYSIVNRNYVGCTPKCLEDLTEVELSMITPVRGYGYCHTYTGGKMKNLKGTMSFLRVQERKICRAVMHLVGMGLCKHIVVILSGKMTQQQRDKAKAKGEKIRTDKIIAAVEWLCCNHRRWQSVDLEAFKEELNNCTPVVVDKSEIVSGENENIEERELFQCYYPDGATNERTGGFDDPDVFKQYVNDLQANGFDPELQLKLNGEWINGEDGDMLISSCPLQFPYGIGGINMNRVKADNTYTSTPDLVAFMQHLSKLSQPCFQRPLFQLVLYNQICKLKLLRKSRLQVRGQHRVDALANGINANDLATTIRYRNQGHRNMGTNASRTLLNCVDACTKTLPHTNDAAKLARSSGEAMQHHLGIGSLFITVNFDDENNLLMQVFSYENIDNDTPLNELSDADLAQLTMKRKSLRLNFPGLSAINFEVCLAIVMEEVIGWDLQNNCSTVEPGYFGTPIGVAMAVEEQGRKTPHGHITVWLKGFNAVRKTMFFGTRREKRKADALLRKFQEHTTTTNFFPSEKWDLRGAFDHACTVDLEQRCRPTVIGDQELRNLRHINGYAACGGKFAYCPHCNYEWTYEALVNSYTRSCGEIQFCTTANNRDTIEEDVIPKDRMLRRIVQFQLERDVAVTDTPTTCINAVYNQHASNHVSKSCFKCQQDNKKKKLHTHSSKCECRMRLPDRGRQKAQVRTINASSTWFEWTGEERQQPLVEFLPRRCTYDLFQNKSIPAVSETKMACNSNISMITDGPVSGYMIKYNFKSTQKDDTAEYAHVEQSIKSLNGRVHSDDRKEAIRLLCRAAFAHNRANVVGTPLASYLIRNGSRFYFSHSFTYCPLKDLVRVLNNERISVLARYHGENGTMYFENQALHYLCRHSRLENVSLKTFFEEFKIVGMSANPTKKKRKRNDDEDADDEPLRFINDTGHFQHPSAVMKGGTLSLARQGVKPKEELTFIKVAQWMFPDTAKFKANILFCGLNQITIDMEEYAMYVLTLLLPHRSINDLKPINPVPRFPHVFKLREVYNADKYRDVPLVFNDNNMQFLQNIQDSAYNSMRYKITDDDLQSVTQPFYDDMSCLDPHDDDGDDSDADDCDDAYPYESILNQFEEQDVHDEDPHFLPDKMKGFSFQQIRNAGRRGCGYNSDLPIPEVQPTPEDFVHYIPSPNNDSTSNVPLPSQYPETTMKDIVRLLLVRGKPRKRSKIFINNPNAEVGNANASYASIAQWARAAKLDRVQKRAFECIVASFLLTFFDDAGENDTDDTAMPSERTKYRRAKLHLLRLRGTKKERLCCLLHGPGGSGKSTVINLVVDYAREFCEHLKHPFTSRTIVITAMSGVAATLLKGETAHMAMGLNMRSVSQEMVEAWEDTRLVIVDETSFASEDEFDSMFKNCQDLKQKPFEGHGGLSIVFAGDFSQLEPPCRSPIYKNGRRVPTFHGELNAFIELNGMHRFRDDPIWGHRLFRFRQGRPTLEDIRTINNRCLVSEKNLPPAGVQIATHRNKDRDAMNSAIFEDYCEENAPPDGGVLNDACVILMDQLTMQDSRRTYVPIKSNTVKRHFWSTCSEDSCFVGQKSNDGGKKNRGGRVDPVLKLYPNCPMMLTKNKDVPNGQANGSRVFLKQVHVKPGEQPFILELGNKTKVRAFFASQVNHLVLEHENPDIKPSLFDCKSEDFKFDTVLRADSENLEVKMAGTQFAIISNSATTGHKLQGVTARSLLVNGWHYGQNWAYVVLSRVRTMAGLFLTEPLSEDLSKYEMSADMTNMIDGFRTHKALESISAEEYERMLDESLADTVEEQ